MGSMYLSRVGVPRADVLAEMTALPCADTAFHACGRRTCDQGGGPAMIDAHRSPLTAHPSRK